MSKKLAILLLILLISGCSRMGQQEGAAAFAGRASGPAASEPSAAAPPASSQEGPSSAGETQTDREEPSVKGNPSARANQSAGEEPSVEGNRDIGENPSAGEAQNTREAQDARENLSTGDAQSAGETQDAGPPKNADETQNIGGPQAAEWVDGLHPYLYRLVQQALDSFCHPGMSEYERAKAAFDYMIDHTVFDAPVGPELWRIHGGGDAPIPYLQQKALSPLRFEIGMCEDYAAALVLLLRGMGLAAEYVPGLTYSAEGHLVDHAWTAVRIDGVWYHLDSQLEDNVSRNGMVRYRYFLLGDATLCASHRWGQNLIDSGLLTQQQNEEIHAHYLLPACPRDYPRPEQRKIEGRAPDKAAAHRQAQAELAEYVAQNGPLPPMELTTLPPVFGRDGYGPADEG